MSLFTSILTHVGTHWYSGSDATLGSWLVGDRSIGCGDTGCWCGAVVLLVSIEVLT